MSYIIWIFLHTNLNRRFALVNRYLGSKINSLRVLVKEFQNGSNSIYNRFETISNETRELFI